MLRHCILYLLLTAAALSSAAQEEFVSPSRLLTKFRFRMLTGGVVILEARFHDKPDTLNFILDTGSGGISLDSTTAHYFGLKPQASNRTIRGIGGLRAVSFLYGRSLHLPGLSIDSLSFHVNDYTLLTEVYGERIDGIIGYSFLSRYIVKMNYDSLYMEVWTPGAMRYPRGGYFFRPQINTLPVTTARVRDATSHEARFLYDMGAGLNLLLSTDFARDSAVISPKRRRFTKQAEGLGGKVDMTLTVAREVRIGPYRFRNVPVHIFDDDYNVTSYPYLGGLIGNDLLRRFNVVLDYGNRAFYLTPNTHFQDPFDYSYSGVELYAVDGQIIVGDVAKGSPSEKAGLKEGDVVVGINRNFGQDMSVYKLALQTITEPIKMIVRRGGELLTVSFKVQHIMRRR